MTNVTTNKTELRGVGEPEPPDKQVEQLETVGRGDTQPSKDLQQQAEEHEAGQA